MHRSTIKHIATALLFLLRAWDAASAAPATERVRWEHSGGFVMQSRRWDERIGNDVTSLVETARNPVFVELFDPGHGYTMRLYDDRMLIRGGNSAMGGKILRFTKRAEGHWQNPARTKWADPDGTLEADGDAWFESVPQGVNMFLERTHTPEFVELRDPQRDYTIRLSANAMQIRGGNFKDFTKLHDGRWTAIAPPAKVTMTPDVSEAPGLRDWALGAKELAERWYPIITQRLSPNRSPDPRVYKLIMKNMMNNPAVTSWPNRHMTIHADYVVGHPDDWGMVIHELTHAIQEYPGAKGTTWLAEGIADYIRYFEFEPEKPLPPFPNKTFRDGYRTAAAFLNWVALTCDARLIETLHARLLAHTYSDNIFQEITGRSVDQLWSDYQKEQATH